MSNTCGMFIEDFSVISQTSESATLSVTIGSDIPGSAIQYSLKDANETILTHYQEVHATTRISPSSATCIIYDTNLSLACYLSLRLIKLCDNESGGSGSLSGGSEGSVGSGGSGSSSGGSSESGSGGSGSSGCLSTPCSKEWDPSECLQRTINNPCYLNDGKLPASNPSQVTVKLSKTLTLNYGGYTATLTYDQITGSWESQGIGGWTATLTNGLLVINYQGSISYTISVPIRYRELYGDYTVADSFTTTSVSGSAENCILYNYPTISCFGETYVTQPCALVDEQGHVWISNGLSDGAPSYAGPVSDPPGLSPRIYLFKYDGVWYLAPDQDPNQAIDQQPALNNEPPLSWGQSSFVPFEETVISFTQTCREALPLSNCEICINTPATEYTALPSYPNYYDGCIGRPIDIDIDACDGTIQPNVFTKPSFVLYYAAGSDVFLVIDDVAYDPRGISGLIKIFETSTPEDMRQQVCSRLRFASLVDETKLSTDINAALTSNWPYNDLYWYSACGNLPDEVPINLIPC